MPGVFEHSARLCTQLKSNFAFSDRPRSLELWTARLGKLWVITTKVRVTGQDVDRYWQKRIEFYKARVEAPPVNVLVRQLWAGDVHYTTTVRHPDLAIVQGHRGAGRLHSKPRGRFLGRSDAGVIMWRRILSRELRAIA